MRAAGAKLAGVSVDSPEKSQAVRDEFHLSFPILCDTGRRVVREWSIYNAREKGGIAKPAAFIIDPGRIVRFVSVDEVSSRIPASEIALLLSARDGAPTPERRKLIPRPGNFFRAVRNSVHFGVHEPEPDTK